MFHAPAKVALNRSAGKCAGCCGSTRSTAIVRRRPINRSALHCIPFNLSKLSKTAHRWHSVTSQSAKSARRSKQDSGQLGHNLSAAPTGDECAPHKVRGPAARAPPPEPPGGGAVKLTVRTDVVAFCCFFPRPKCSVSRAIFFFFFPRPINFSSARIRTVGRAKRRNRPQVPPGGDLTALEGM